MKLKVACPCTKYEPHVGEVACVCGHGPEDHEDKKGNPGGECWADVEVDP